MKEDVKMNEEKVERGKQIVKELSNILQELSDIEIGELLGTGALNDVFNGILDPNKAKDRPILDFLLENKARTTILALMRIAISQNYSFKIIESRKEYFISPLYWQWFEDGVMFQVGDKPFEGPVALYRNKEVRYAITARDIKGGEKAGPEDFRFMTTEEYNEIYKKIPLEQITDLEKPLRELRTLLDKNERKESLYQELIEKYPWVLGAEYEAIQDHRKLDDKNIPDFTGVRVKDRHRDIFEIKHPFIPISRKDGEFTSDFNDAWNQIEDYLNFGRQNADYLRQKGLLFDNPKCYLIMGYNLTDEELKKIRIKERLNPAIEILTYNDLIVFMESTINFIKQRESEKRKRDSET